MHVYVHECVCTSMCMCVCGGGSSLALPLTGSPACFCYCKMRVLDLTSEAGFLPAWGFPVMPEGMLGSPSGTVVLGPPSGPGHHIRRPAFPAALPEEAFWYDALMGSGDGCRPRPVAMGRFSATGQQQGHLSFHVKEEQPF